MAGDFRHAVKALAQSRGYTTAGVLTLALGIGASTAIFTALNALLLRPLPYADPSRLVDVSAPAADRRTDTGWLSYGHFTYQRDRNRSFAGLAACTFEIFNLTGRGDPEQVPSGRVSWNFFQVLGVQPPIGRTFLPEEDQRGARRVALISHELWQRLFGGNPNAVGQSLALDSQDYTIIGVLPPKLPFPIIGEKVDIWAPRVFDLSLVTPARVEAGGTYYRVVGRLRPGVTRERARAEAAGIYQQYRQDNPGKYDATIDVSMQVRDLHQQFVAEVRPTLLVLAGAVALLLLIACSNVASLELARALGRRREFVVRTALGAPRRAIVRQVLTENLLLSLASAALGGVLGWAATRYLASLDAASLPLGPRLEPDWRVLAFGVAVAALSAALIGVLPALELSRSDLNTVLRDEGRGSAGSRKRRRARGALVVAQVAFSTVLLVGSGLLLRSFVRLTSVNPGFQPGHLLTLEMTLPGSKYAKRAQLTGFYNGVLREVGALAGVESAALSTAAPTVATHQTPALFEGQPAAPLGKRPIVNLQQISPGYTHALRIPLRSGRLFSGHDDAQAPPVALVNEAAARRFWPNENPIGKRVWIGKLPDPYQVVGVMADVKNSGLAAAVDPELFLPLPQFPWTLLYLSARTAGDPHGIVPAVRRAIAAVDREQPLTRVLTGEELLASASAPARATAFLVGVFSALAFAIAAVGIYGVIAYSVAQRTPELGIRIAIGAAESDVLRLVIGGGLRLTAGGILIGLAAALGATRLLAALLYRTSATDPATFAASAALFLAVSVLAAYLPARRATSIDPAEALRAE